MTVKLLTIGDSISQGFMSFAAARTDLAYSTLIAEKLGLTPGTPDYRFPKWAEGGLPLNLEMLLRKLQDKYGTDIDGLDWASLPHTFGNIVGRVEDYYERGAGRADRIMLDSEGNPTDFFHNIAVQGSKIADAWLVTPGLCKQVLKKPLPINNSLLRFWEDGSLGTPDREYYRTALKVLNPSLAEKYDGHHALRWLEKHAVEDDGVENLILWLGGNNALSTVISLKINPTEDNPHVRPHTLSRREREEIWEWHLWRLGDFEAEYEALMKRVVAIMQQNKHKDWKVFIGNIPLITIAPIIKAFGKSEDIVGKGHYFDTYTWFLRTQQPSLDDTNQLEKHKALFIDDMIRQYNVFIKQHLEDLNNELGQTHFHLVDVSEALDKLAYKRNDGKVKYKFPKYFDTINPKVDTRYYCVNEKKELKEGGIFSLDGIHPSAIGQGLIAWEFLKIMQDAGVVADTDLDWDKIFDSDKLYNKPIALIHEIYDHPLLVETLLRLFKLT